MKDCFETFVSELPNNKEGTRFSLYLVELMNLNYNYF